MRRSRIFIALFFFLSIGRAQLLYGDVVHLKNGGEIEGEIIEGRDDTVSFKTKIGQVTFRRDGIISLEKKELPPNFFEEETEEKMPQPDETAPKAEGYKNMGPQRFNLNVEAKLKKRLDGDAIFINGTTNLPPKTVLYFTVKTPSQIIAVFKKSVKSPSFSSQVGPFGDKGIPPGSYIVEAIFSPETQESEKIQEMLAGTKEIVATSSIIVGAPEETEEKISRRRAELILQLKELDRLYNELNCEYETQKDFNETRWNTWLLKWQPQLETMKTLNENYQNKTLVLDFPLQENALNEIICDLELLRNRYIAELFKKNKLSFKAPPSNDTRGPDLLRKTIQDKLKTSGDFFIASKKSD